ncbi:hypothetical protein [Kribbella deserti]|uniref:Uncharacterized protein n=1 Tax=Kribbella deserti TaxID=1926257 RepID=A0ABV6QJA3_9ACTN
MNQRSIDMIEEAEHNLGFTLKVMQGSFNNGAVKASADVHDGGGAADFRARTLDAVRRRRVLEELRRVGFAAWLRTPAQGFVIHFHAVAIGDEELSPGARRQVKHYKNGLNGLASGGRDDGPPGFRGMTWEKYQEIRDEARAVQGVPSAFPVRDVTISITSVRMAAEGEPISHSRAHDAEQFMAFAFKGIKVIPVTTFMAWRKTRETRFFVFAVKCVQAHFKLRQDGDPGPITLANLTQFGYRITD